MATFNGAKYVEDQLKSVLKQDYPISSIKVFDDASTDDTVNKLEKVSKKNLIEIHKNFENIGLVRNFKNGIKSALNGGYIALCDQDDIWLPNKIRISIKKMIETECDQSVPTLVYSDLSVINEANQITAKSFWDVTGRGNYKHCLETVIYGNVVNGCTTLMNQALADHAKDIPDGVSGNHDAWLALIAFTFGNVGVIKEPTVLYRQHQRNLTFNTSHKKPSFFRRSKMHISYVFAPSEYLNSQFLLIDAFFNTYKSQMNTEQLRLFEDFLSLKDKSYFQKKIRFWKSFKPYWQKPRLI